MIVELDAELHHADCTGWPHLFAFMELFCEPRRRKEQVILMRPIKAGLPACTLLFEASLQPRLESPTLSF